MRTKALPFLLLILLLTVLVLAACSVPDTTTDDATDIGSEPNASEPSVSLTTTPKITTEKPLTVGNPSAIGMVSDKNSSLPVIHINTEGGAEIVSRDEYIGATVSVSGTLDDSIFGFENRETEVRCRGNFTYTGTEKKSYRLKFTEKVNLFGQGWGPAKSWVLLANHCDKSFLRNHLAFTAGRLLDNIDYCTSSSFVKLYVNGDYYGIYQVAEQHNINDYRVAIAEDPNEVDTDYLIERDSYAADDGVEGTTYFRINRTKYNINTDYPDSTLARDKCEFLRRYFEATHEAIKGGSEAEVTRYIDLDSFIDTFILQALVKNTDVGYSSFFMVKKAGGKIYFTCPWDFDLSLGNDERLDNGQVETLYIGEKTEMSQQHEWFYLLMNEDWFCDKLLARWNEVKEDLRNAMLYEIDRFLVAFEDDIATNFEVWNVLGRKINQEPRTLLKFKTYRENVTHLRGWFLERYTYIDTLFNSEELYNQGGYESSGGWWEGGGWWN
ncbi:MAG: CotH kinase family protein [Clostridia bacterium]|nr:CotH kinase family protein [Clostridia bacterium]